MSSTPTGADPHSADPHSADPHRAGPHPQHRADPYEALADELGRIGRRIDGMGAELRALRSSGGAVVDRPYDERSTPVVAAGPAGAAGPVASAPGHPGGPPWPGPGQPWAGPALPAAPWPAPGPGAPPWAPPGQALPAPAPWAPPGQEPGAGPAPRRGRRMPQLSGARLVVWTGGAVTLLGVVMLLVLAVSRGWFSPQLRVIGGALFGMALIGVGARLHRSPSARAGALAVAATGFATLYLVVAAASAVYGYLAALPALGIAVVVAAAGLGVADRWRSQLLGTGVVAGAALLAPVLTTDWLLVALAIALQSAAVPVLLRRRWPVLMLVSAAGPVLYGWGVGAIDVGGGGQPVALSVVAVVLGVLAVGTGTAVLAARLIAERAVAVLVAAAALPVLATGAALAGWAGAALAGAAVLAAAGVAAMTGERPVVRVTAVAVAALSLFEATLVALDGAGAVTVVLGGAVLAAVVAATTRSRTALVIALVFGLWGVLAGFEFAPPPAEFPYPADPGFRTAELVAAAGIAALVLALAVALLVGAGRIGWVRPDSRSARLWAPIGVVGLYGATTLVVALALLVSPDRTGFTVGHALVTVSWTVGALVLLARGLTRPALRVTGLVLVAAAVAKLVLFDLVALDGIARVGAFLGAGLLLLAAGTRYARLVAEAEAVAEVVAGAGAGAGVETGADAGAGQQPAPTPPGSPG